MNVPLLAGLFGAWTAVQVAIGVFFLLAYAARRQQVEYLLFGLVCFALAVSDAGMTAGYFVSTYSLWLKATVVTNFGAFFAAALNVHFVLRYVSGRSFRRWLVVGYAFAVLFSGLAAVPRIWFAGESPRFVGVDVMGSVIRQIMSPVSGVAIAGYVIIVASTVGMLGLLLREYRRGNREALSTLVGLGLACSFAINDVLVSTGTVESIFLTPYGFLLYGIGVANTLLLRYRTALLDLERTASDLRRTTQELTSSYVELSDVQEELFRRRQLASVGELAASIAHEVRNPLAVIVNAAANLRRQGLSPDDRGTLFGIIEEETTRLNDLVTELLRYARPVSVQRAETSLEDALAALGKGLPDEWTLKTEIAPDPEVRSVWGDPALLRLALGNLVDNARQAMPSGGEIRVRAFLRDADMAPRVCIEVADSGPGMDEETRQRAKDPFFTTRPRGTGLGLPISVRIIEAHDGTLEVESELGRGTTVRLLLPPRRRDSLPPGGDGDSGAPRGTDGPQGAGA